MLHYDSWLILPFVNMKSETCVKIFSIFYLNTRSCVLIGEEREKKGWSCPNNEVNSFNVESIIEIKVIYSLCGIDFRTRTTCCIITKLPLYRYIYHV